MLNTGPPCIFYELRPSAIDKLHNVLYSREGLFSLKGGSRLRKGNHLLHKEPSPKGPSAICCMLPAQSSPSKSLLLGSGNKQGQIDPEFLSTWQPLTRFSTLNVFFFSELFFSALRAFNLLSLSLLVLPITPEGHFFHPNYPFTLTPFVLLALRIISYD